MYNFATPGETIKRTPKADDIAGICAIYPKANDPVQLQPRHRRCTGGCSIGSARAARVGVGLALLAARPARGAPPATEMR